MNLIFECEQCGVNKPCILVMVNTETIDSLEFPKICVNGGTATWKLKT